MDVLDRDIHRLGLRSEEPSSSSSTSTGTTAREAILENIRGSMNFDGGFGTEPGAESHGGQGKLLLRHVGEALLTKQVWVCVAALALLDRLDVVDRDLLGAWLSERQLPNGGLNGRPEKLEDVSQRFIELVSQEKLMR